MRQYTLIFILLIITNIYSQTSDKIFNIQDFEKEIINYVPVKRENVTDKQFKKGIYKLNEVKAYIKKNPKDIKYIEYWNITSAFLNLKEPKKNIEIAFSKAIEKDSQSVCAIIDAYGIGSLDKRIPELFISFYKNCSNKTEQEKFNITNYIKENNLKSHLVLLINQIHQDDISYRKNKTVNWEKQNPLDTKNQKLIDSLYDFHKTYIGKSMVGEEFQTTMWTVIQHSNVEIMEKYLPIIQIAVSEKELDIVPFKMLIDRFYGLKYGYQIFGSQGGFGFELADKKKRKEIELKYGIE